MEPQLKMGTCMGIVYYCKNSNLLRQWSEYSCAPDIYHQMTSVTTAMHCTAKQFINLKSDPNTTRFRRPDSTNKSPQTMDIDLYTSIYTYLVINRI